VARLRAVCILARLNPKPQTPLEPPLRCLHPWRILRARTRAVDTCPTRAAMHAPAGPCLTRKLGVDAGPREGKAALKASQARTLSQKVL
jgi:hypothetical protein